MVLEKKNRNPGKFAWTGSADLKSGGVLTSQTCVVRIFPPHISGISDTKCVLAYA